LPRGLTASPASTLRLPLNSEVAACGAVLPTRIPSKRPVFACGASKIEFATPAIASAVWPGAQVPSVGSVVTVVDVARLTLPQLAVAARIAMVTLTCTRAFILSTNRGEDGFAICPAVNVLRANSRGDGCAAVKVRGRNARAAVAVTAPRVPSSDRRIRCVRAVLRRSIALLAEAVAAVAGRGICLRPFDSIHIELSHTRVVRKRLLDIGELVLSTPLRTSCDAESCLVVLWVPLPLVVVNATAVLAASCAPSAWAAPIGRPDIADRQVDGVPLASAMSRGHCCLCERRQCPRWALPPQQLLDETACPKLSRRGASRRDGWLI